ncbi:MAG: hypothetical protein IPM29_25190 [Planctomycetes bacterium]|nr:hypothetical protein [Planctomycetota bacterium]
MNLVCAVAAADFDATQPCDRRATAHLPEADTILLLGAGGREAWSAVRRRRPGPLPRPHRRDRLLDDWSEDIGRELLADLRADGFGGRLVRPDDPRTLNFRQLAEMGGLGTISPVLGHLLHPVFGPWVSLRIAVVLAGRPFGDVRAEALVDFEPCNTCARPCVGACPVRIYATDRPDFKACAEWRVAGGCDTGCESLRACPIGSEHRYEPEDEAWRQAQSLVRMRRWIGAGAWQLLPRFVRRRL